MPRTLNILSLLTPKKDVAYVLDTNTIRQVLEKMEFHHYSMIPVLNEEGNYISSISEGDLLWYLKDHDLDMRSIEQLPITAIKPSRNIEAVKVNATEQEVRRMVVSQNYVPVVDDRNMFIGIVTRRAIVQYYASQN